MTTQIVEEPTSDQLENAAVALRLLGDPTRLNILWALLHGEHAVNDLAEHVGAQPAAVSQHLAKLRLHRLVKSRRDGNRIFYRVENAHIERLVTDALWHAEHVTDELPAHHRKQATRSKSSSSKKTA